MKRIFPGILVLLLGPPLCAQTRVDAGITAGMQSYETRQFTARVLVGAEVMASRDRLALYYAIEHADLSSAGSMYASHLGVAYRWPLGRNVAIRAGAGPSYVSVEHLGGEPTWHAQVELGVRTGRLEWFAKVRQYDYTLSAFRVAEASPDGPALLAGVRFTVRQ
jgi:hypothetical protein